MAAKPDKDLTRHLLEVVGILKVLTTTLTKIYPSATTDDLAAWSARGLDTLRQALEAE